jgi:hypothetical protein
MIKIQLLLIGLGFAIVFVTWLFASQIIWLLGDNYANLEFELVLSIIILYLNIIANVISSMCRGRGWVLNPLLSITINLSTIIIGAFLLDIRSLVGVLLLNITVSVVLVVMHSLYSFKVLNKLEF